MALMTFERNRSDDVMWAAEILGISERQLFEQAYLSSHRQAVNREQLETFYALYHTQGTAPVWVIRFSRQVLTDHAPLPRPRMAKACSHLGLCLELAIHLYIPPHAPETLGPDRYRTFVA